MMTYEEVYKLNSEFQPLREETIYDFSEDEIKDRIVSIDAQIQIVSRTKKAITDEFTSYIKKLRNQKESIQAENLRRKSEGEAS